MIRAAVSVLLFAAGAILGGCSSTGSVVGDMLLYGPIGGATVYGNAQNAKLVAAGRYPAPELVHQCQRDALVRDGGGAWVTDRARLFDCYTAAGWTYGPDYRWSRTEEGR